MKKLLILLLLLFFCSCGKDEDQSNSESVECKSIQSTWRNDKGAKLFLENMKLNTTTTMIFIYSFGTCYVYSTHIGNDNEGGFYLNLNTDISAEGCSQIEGRYTYEKSCIDLTICKDEVCEYYY